MGVARLYTSRRQAIVNALAELLKSIDGTHPFLTDLEGRVEARMRFWDEVEAYPAVHVTAGSETRDYKGGGYRDRYMTVTIRCYVQEEDANLALESLIEDVETCLEENSSLQYTDKQGNKQRTHQISIITIDTDEGVLEPLGVGEILVEVQY